MAGTNIPARATITGSVHRVTPSATAARDDRAPQPVANVVVLTDGGGFCEVYLDPEKVAAGCTPKVGDRVLWVCDVDTWTRTNQQGNRYTRLFVKLADAYDAAAHSPNLQAV